MKKSLLSLALLALMVGGIGAAHADTNTNANSPSPNDLTRFDLSCTWGSTGCSADARLFLNTRTINSAHPDWFGPLLAVNCRGQLISASDAQLFRTTDNDGVHWEIFNSDQTVEIDLKDHPFDGHPNPKTVTAILEIGHGSDTGTCTISAHDVH